jgi:hypothetical protein
VKRALHSLIHLVVVAIVMAMTVSPASADVDTGAFASQVEQAPASDCDEPSADTETVICGEGLMPSHVQMDPGLYAMSVEDCESLLNAIYARAACDPLDQNCGAVTPGAVPPPSPKLLGSGSGFTIDHADDAWADAQGSRLIVTDDRLPASLVLEPPLRPPLTLV